MPKRFHSSVLLVAVFALGIAGGVAVMLWAWPGVRDHFHRRHGSFMDYLQHSLKLTPQQMPKVRAVFQDAGERGDQIHEQFVPAYAKICDQYMQVLGQERQAFAPLRQQEMQRMQSVLTPPQWKEFSAQAAAVEQRRAHYRPDVCRHLEKQQEHQEHKDAATSTGGPGAHAK